MKKLMIAAALAAALALPAMAQDTSAAPTYGTLNLSAGFNPDPRTVQVQSGGPIDASGEIGQGCTGFIARAPDVRVNYTAGSLPLIFKARSSADTTLVVNLPNGQWACDDDSGEAPNNPQLRFNSPQSGQYDVWIGTFGGATNAATTFIVTELTGGQAGGGGQIQAAYGAQGGGGASGGSGAMPDTSAAPIYATLNLRAGFQPDPTNVQVQSGGIIDASVLGNNCTGNVARAPDVRVNYTAGRSLPFVLSVNSTADTTLVVNLPNGDWACDDDGGNNGLNPALTFNQPQSGQYDIWIGTFGGATNNPATLSVSELYSH